MAWCFRLRFNLGSTSRFECNDPEWVINESPKIFMKPADGASILSEARILVLYGEGFVNEDEAQNAGEQWRSWLTAAFVEVNIAADFGDRATSGLITDAGRAVFNKDETVRLLDDIHGLMVFKEGPALTRFVKMGTPTIMVSFSHDKLIASLQDARDNGVIFTDQYRLAYDLYAASTSDSNPDSRFVMLMMALETLINVQDRPPQSRSFVSSLISQTQNSGLPSPEINSLVGALKWLKKESISQAGRSLAQKLSSTYNQEDPTTFFTRCYELRSKLVHGYHPRPERHEIGLRAAHLETFIRDLLTAMAKGDGDA